MTRLHQWFLLTLAITLYISTNTAKADNTRTINIQNKSGRTVEVHWINPQTEELILQSTPHIVNGATFTLNSYVTHAFQARELGNSETGLCEDSTDHHSTNTTYEECRISYFTVNSKYEQLFILDSDFTMTHIDNTTMIHKKAKKLVEHCNSTVVHHDSTQDTITSLSQCLVDQLLQEFHNATEELTFQTHMRTDMAELLENYTCHDDTLATSEPQDTQQWTYNGSSHEVNVYHERPASKIHVIEQFVSSDQCGALLQSHNDTLGTIQASIRIPWEHELTHDPIATLARKSYTYANAALDGLTLTEHHQEDLRSIITTGNHTTPDLDRNLPHCNGDCTGPRIATMIFYCQNPEKGGATHFRNVGLHILPMVGDALFVSYLDGGMDVGFTEYSECSVSEGEKHVVLQWMRGGASEVLHQPILTSN